MPKESILNFINSKKDYQSKLTKILRKYYVRFISRLYDKSLREFQKDLLKIPDWSSEKISKEFSKFVNFSNDKFDLDKDDLTKLLTILIGLNIKIMSSITDDIEINVPKFEQFWFKCLKRVAKYYYENPKVMLSDLEFETSLHTIDEAINYIIQKYIPLKQILNKKREPLDMYNFDDDENENDTLEDKKEHQSTNNIEVTLESNTAASENELKYLSSEEFENEYYKSDKENDKEVEKSEEKHIKIKKYVFPRKNYKKKQPKNEIDENFFDDL